jgi:hypothetical protein
MASEVHVAIVPDAGAREQPLPELPDEGEVAAFDPEVPPLDWDALPLAPVAVVVPLATAPVAPEPAVSPPVPELVVEPLVPETPPLLVPDVAVAPLEKPVDAPLEAPLAVPLSSDPLWVPPESSGASVPASTAVVAMPVAPQKRRYCVLVLVTSTPVSIAVLDGVS